jgi:serpin B
MAILVVSQTIIGCHDSTTSPPQSPTKTPPTKTATQSQTVTASNAFGLSLLANLNTSDKDSNVVISPLSVSMALGMTMNGAAGATHDSMQSVLGFSGMTDTSIDQSYLGLINELNGLDPSTAFTLANSIWYRQTFAVEPAFLNLNETYFDAAVRPLNFNDPAAAGTINAWVDSETNGKIPAIVDPPISDSTMMYLINAVYFKASWVYQFDSSQTQQDPFIMQGPTTPNELVPMMYQSKTFLYYQNQSLQMVDLPYGNGNYRMTVMLPEGDIDAFVSGLNPTSWTSWINGLDSAKMWLYLPRFTVTCNFELSSALSAMGMSTAFSRVKADFSGISDAPGLHIDKVNHKVYIKVGEMGTEAAATTSVITVFPEDVVLPPPGTVEMVVNHPFVFVIRDASTGTILFIGKVSNPLG